MNMQIVKMVESDKEEVINMMRGFYASPAVLTNGSEEIFENDVMACVDNKNPYAEGYVFKNEKGKICGYSMLAKSFSTEFGKPCIWIEDLFVKEEYQNNGIGKQYFEFLNNTYKNVLFRLEVEEENKRAVHLYKKCGFEIMPYVEMKK